MKTIKPFLIALQVLTCFPVRLRKQPTVIESRKSLMFFPVIGLLLGSLLIGIEYLLSYVLAESLVKLLLLGTLVVITGGLHLDGVADTVDALVARKGRKESLQIMKDSTIGPMGVMAILGCLTIKYVVLLEFFIPRLYLVLLFFPLIGRMAMVFACRLFPYARGEGTGQAFIGKGGKIELIIAGLISIVTSYILLGPRGLIILGVVFVITILAGRLFVKKFGGITGDILGFMNEVGELVALIGAIIII